ncbi:MAG: hypothetical protein Q8O70_08850 [Burkholderiales bacterium]|nr:hypothetical protein [Burkholderiales bacterium]
MLTLFHHLTVTTLQVLHAMTLGVPVVAACRGSLGDAAARRLYAAYRHALKHPRSTA